MPNHFGSKNFTERDEESWISIVDLIFAVVEQLVIKQTAHCGYAPNPASRNPIHRGRK
jgi:hypothetical protein